MAYVSVKPGLSVASITSYDAEANIRALLCVLCGLCGCVVVVDRDAAGSWLCSLSGLQHLMQQRNQVYHGLEPYYWKVHILSYSPSEVTLIHPLLAVKMCQHVVLNVLLIVFT